jgi:hypothetical protein
MLNVWTQDCMTRIFPNQALPENMSREIRLQLARNEVGDFQIGISGPPDGLNDLSVEASDLVSEDGKRISKENVDVLYAEYVPVHWHSAGNTPDDLEGQAPGFYPDPLVPSLWRGVGRVQFPGTVSAWVRVRVGEGIPAGSYRGSLKITCKAGKEDVQVEVNVWPFALDERSHFLMTIWFLPGLIMKFHKLEPLTDRFWKVVDVYARNLSAHRQNVILTPLFRISGTRELLDGRLRGQLIDMLEDEPGKYKFDFHNFDRWVRLFLGWNFQAIEGSHLAGGARNPAGILLRKPGQSEAEHRNFASTLDPDYRAFLQQFLTALRAHLQENGWLGQFYLHLSDEPHGDQFEAYTGLAKFVKSVAPEIHLIDAMGAAEYAPYIDHPVPLESQYEKFVETSGIPREQIWFYYCCGPTGAWPNRFIDYPLIRVRIFTWLAFRYGIPGFLHWGLNHWGWHPPVYTEHEYNPYDNTTGGSLQAGDSYVLYPPKMASKTDEPVDSIRWEIMRKAMEDYEYLYMLRELADAGNEQARGLLRELEEDIVPSFTGHTRDPRYLEDFRLRVGQTIAGERKG